MTVPRIGVSVDLVVLTIRGGQLTTLVWRRDSEPYAGMVALPGGFIRLDEDLPAAAGRVLAERAGLPGALVHLEQLRSFGTSSGYASVVVFALYIGNEVSQGLYPHHTRLWLLVPVLLLWISRLWLIASRGDLHEDPVIYSIMDKRSLLLGVIVVAIVISASL